MTLFVAISVNAQLQHYIDSLNICKARIDSLQRSLDSLRNGNAANGKYFRLFAPLTFYPDVVESVMGGNGKNGSALDEVINNTLMQSYLKYPELVKTTACKLHKVASAAESTPTAPVRRKVQVADDDSDTKEVALASDSPVRLEIFKPNFWKFSGDYNLQFMQNHFSKNWYKSGDDNLSAVANVILRYNYNNQQKIKFDNQLEMKVGIQNSPSDTIHKFKTTSDLLRYTGKLGLQATKKWYYTFQILATSQFVRGYKSNDPMVYSDFFSPFELNFSVGMDYNIEAFNKKLTGSLHIAPLAHNFKHVSRLDLATRYGIPEGHHGMNDWGSQFTALRIRLSGVLVSMPIPHIQEPWWSGRIPSHSHSAGISLPRCSYILALTMVFRRWRTIAIGSLRSICRWDSRIRCKKRPLPPPSPVGREPENQRTN